MVQNFNKAFFLLSLTIPSCWASPSEVIIPAKAEEVLHQQVYNPSATYLISKIKATTPYLIPIAGGFATFWLYKRNLSGTSLLDYFTQAVRTPFEFYEGNINVTNKNGVHAGVGAYLLLRQGINRGITWDLDKVAGIMHFKACPLLGWINAPK